MTKRERISRIMNFEEPDRIGVFDWYWGQTCRRWRAEGLAENADFSALFDHDLCLSGFDQSFRLPSEVVEQDDETIVERNSFGATERRWKNDNEGAPHQVDWLIKTRADWDKYKERFLSLDGRISEDYVRGVLHNREKGIYVNFFYLEPFELTWRYFGFSQLLMLMAADPGFLHDLFEACIDQILGCFEIAESMGAKFDGTFAGGDIAAKNGPLFSPKMYRELLMPHHKRLFGYFNERGLLTQYHTDGNARPFFDLLIESGVRAVHPLEVKAGNDLVELKRDFGDRLVLFGGIDVRALSGTKEEIDREVRTKKPVAMKGGGYIYCTDHSVAPTVSLENYEYAIKLIREVGTY